jgi:hypothetical protein
VSILWESWVASRLKDCSRLISADAFPKRRKSRTRKKKQGKRKEEEEEEEDEKGHTNQQVVPPKNISNPSFSLDCTVPFRNSTISDPTLIDLSMRRRMWDYAFLGDCNILMEGRRGGSVCQLLFTPTGYEGNWDLTSLVKVRSARIDSLNILP